MSETSDPQQPDQSEQPATVLVADAPGRGRFEISVDGVPVGFTVYDDAPAGAGGVRTFPHTEIDEAYGGRGLSTILIQTALDATRTAGLTVVPQCASVRHFIATHADYLDLVPAERRPAFGL